MTLRLSDHQKSGRFVNVDGLNIFTVDKGKGPVVVLLHGLFSSSYSFRKMVPILAENFRVIAPDLPGIGLSEKPNWVYSHRQLAKFLSSYLDTMTDERIHLVAYDYGAPISFMLLWENPEKIKTLTLISPFQNLQRLRYYTPLFWLHRKIIGNLISKFIGKKAIRFLMNRYMVSPDKPLSEDIIEDYQFLLLHGENRKNFVRMCQNIDRGVYAKKDMEEGMRKMIGGRQILLGNRDRLVSFSEIQNIKQYFRLSLSQNIEGNHMLMEDEPHECAARIENLVKTFSKK
jgi:cis-3-alkyl-4-acyloxetan-2-one decarboxylase